MGINEGKYEKVFNRSLDVLDRILGRQGDEALSGDDTVRVKIATSVLASWPRHRQAMASTAEITLAVLKGAAESEAQYREFVREQMPRVGIMRTMPQMIDGGRQSITDLERKVDALQHGRDERLAKALGEVEHLKEINRGLQYEVGQEKRKTA